MNSLTNNFRIDNDLHALLSEATNYVHERAHSGSPAHEVEKGVFERMLKLGHQLFSAFFKIQGEALLNLEWVKAFHRGNIVRKCCLLQDNISIKNGHGKLVFCSTWH